MADSCLILAPRVANIKKNPEGFAQQGQDIKIFRQAVNQARLDPLGDQFVILVEDVSPDLVEKLYRVDFVLVDANRYESVREELSLLYLIAVSHSLGNHTILLTRSADHLPRGLTRHHILTYKDEEIVRFFDAFEATIEKIRGDEDRRPENPIQEFLIERERAEREADLEQKIDDLERQLKNRERRKRINFRKTSG